MLKTFLLYQATKTGLDSMSRFPLEIISADTREQACEIFFQNKTGTYHGLVVAELKNARAVADVYIPPKKP